MLGQPEPAVDEEELLSMVDEDPDLLRQLVETTDQSLPGMVAGRRGAGTSTGGA